MGLTLGRPGLPDPSLLNGSNGVDPDQLRQFVANCETALEAVSADVRTPLILNIPGVIGGVAGLTTSSSHVFGFAAIIGLIGLLARTATLYSRGGAPTPPLTRTAALKYRDSVNDAWKRSLFSLAVGCVAVALLAVGVATSAAG